MFPRAPVTLLFLFLYFQTISWDTSQFIVNNCWFAFDSWSKTMHWFSVKIKFCIPGLLNIFLIGILVMEDGHERSRQMNWRRFRHLQLVTINHSNRYLGLLRGQPFHFLYISLCPQISMGFGLDTLIKFIYLSIYLYKPMNFDKYEYLAYNQHFNTMNYFYVIRR